MNSKKRIITPENLIGLFSLFVFGTLSFILFLILPKNINLPLWNSFLTGLFVIFFLTYEIVIISLVFHYYTKGKQKLVENFNKNRKKYFYGFLIILAISYIIIDYIRNGWMSTIQNLILLIITLLISALLEKKIIKFIYKKQ